MASALYAKEPDIKTLFTLSDIKGVGTTFAEGEKILDKPETEHDGIKDSCIIQSITDAEGVTKYSLVHNTGQSEIVFLPGNKNFVFIEYLGDSVFTHVVCFDHKFPDGSYLYITSGTRVGFLSETSGRLFSGKANPSPLAKPILDDMLKTKE